MQTNRARRWSKHQTGESRCGPDLALTLEIQRGLTNRGSSNTRLQRLQSFEGLKLFPCDCAKTHAIARTQEGRRIFGRIEKLQRSAADQIPAARRTQRINSRLRTADANRTGRNFFARYVAARRRQFLRQPCQKWKTRNEPNAGYSVFTCRCEDPPLRSQKFVPVPPLDRCRARIRDRSKLEFRLDAQRFSLLLTRLRR